MMEHSLLLVVSNTILLVGSGIAFVLPLRKREKGWLWSLPGIVLSFLTVALGYRSGGMMIVFYYLISYLTITLVVNRVTQLSPMDSCYCAVWICISAMAVQEIWLAIHLYGTAAHVMYLQSIAELVVFAGVLFLILSRTVARWMPRGDVYQVGPGQMVSGWLMGGMFVALFHVFMLPHIEYSAGRVLIALCQVCCLTLMLLHMESYKRRVAEKQVDILNLLCSFGAQQYAVGAKNVEIVNHKCEELEQKIQQMEQYLPEEFRSEAKNVIREAQVACDTVVKTGNEVLDIVLTEKKLLAEPSGTQISCIADGELLNFMEALDIYALFSFALEMALESVAQNADQSRRLVDLLVCESQNFLVINMSCSVPFSAALKNRSAVNNYKAMVIRHIAEKYHGMYALERMKTSVTLKLLIPLSQNRS